MSYRRVIREENSIIELSGTIYRITALEGMGASSIVYRAQYQDALSTDMNHHVFIKELFPVSAHGDIYRDEHSAICCTPDGEPIFEEHKRRFLEGNHANLTLLQRNPEQISGNLNSFEAYGTYYTVLSVHGGENLQLLLDEHTDAWQLSEICAIMNKLLDALEVFHRSGYLHLDISPDNILLLPHQALLIDYNSIWDTRNDDPRTFSFSEKTGYSAPEITLRNLPDVGTATDLYSVCAVFFCMLAGRPLSDKEIMGNGLKHCFAEGFPALEGEPESARYKTYQILARGLHTLPRKRYQDISQLRAEFAILEQSAVHPDLISADSEELYALVYDHLLGSLRQTEEESRALLARRKRRMRIQQIVSIVLILSLLCGSLALWRNAVTGWTGSSADTSGLASDTDDSASGEGDASADTTDSYTEEEQQSIDRMVSCLQSNVNTLCIQISAQQKILSEASASDVLEQDATALSELQESMDYQLSYAQSCATVTLSDELTEKLLAINPDFPIAQLQELCLAPVDMELVMTQGFSDLSRMLCGENALQEADSRKAILDAYNNYLDAYIEYLFYEFDYVLLALAPAEAATLLNDNRYNDLFADYYRVIGLSESSQDADVVLAAMNTAAESVRRAQDEMLTKKYTIEWE